MTHVMLDLETMGSNNQAAIVSIGAAQFNLEGVQSFFYSTVSLQSSVDVGLKIDANTVMWWLKQHPLAQKALQDSPAPLRDVLSGFSIWLRDFGEPKDLFVWGNGATFDNVIIDSAYKACGLQRPWPFWNDRCFRTLKAMYPHVQEPDRSGVHHNARDDAIHQANYAARIMGVL